MSSLREYLEKMETPQLEAVLRAHCEGCTNYSLDAVLMICQVLSERSPQKLDAREAFNRLCTYYLSE